MGKDLHALIRKKVILTLLTAAGILMIGILYWAAQGDRILLMLSLAIAVFCSLKVVDYIRKYQKGQIEELAGTCEAVTQKPFSKYKCVRLNAEGGILELWVPKQTRLQAGSSYRLYYWQHSAATGIESLDARICGDMFLGYVPLESPKAD